MPKFPLLNKWFRLKSSLLLVILLSLILLQGVPGGSPDGWIGAFVGMIYLGAFCVGGCLLAGSRFWLTVFGLTSIPILSLGFLSSLYPDNQAFQFASLTLTLALQSLMLVTVIRFTLRSDILDTVDKLIAGICGYLILGMLWANLYAICEIHTAGQFMSSAGQPASEQNGSLLYFSLVTMSTLGYGDFTATTPFTRILSALEAIFGTLYLAIFISTLIPKRSGD